MPSKSVKERSKDGDETESTKCQQRRGKAMKVSQIAQLQACKGLQLADS